jgi:hypothetical protein
MAASAELLALPEQLSAMIVELQANRVVLDRLSIRSSMFCFTGGTIPAQAWCIRCMTSYLTLQSRAAGLVGAEDAKHYLALIETLNELQLGVAAAALPRTLRNRRDITDALDKMLREVLSLGSRLETDLRRSLDAP